MINKDLLNNLSGVSNFGVESWQEIVLIYSGLVKNIIHVRHHTLWII